MNTLEDYLPRNKHDFRRVYQLKDIKRSETCPAVTRSY